MVRLGRGVHRLNEALPPKSNQRSGSEQCFVTRRQEQAVGRAVRPPTGAPHPLKERGHRCRCVDLDHPVEVTNIDPKLQRASRHDHAILPLGKCLFRQAAFLDSQGTVGDEGLDLLLPQEQGKLLPLWIGCRRRPAVSRLRAVAG